MTPSQSHALSPPEIVDCPPRAYAFIAHRVPLADVGRTTADGFVKIGSWLQRHSLVSAGAPFLRYRRIDMAGTLDIEIGKPVERTGVADGAIGFDKLPAGRSARLLWIGPYDSLLAGNAELIAWGQREGITWDVAPGADGDRFGARLETYLVGPGQEPDPAKWQTEIAIRITESNGR